MINVNLLPVEYRKTESTPVGRFLAIVVGAVLVTMASVEVSLGLDEDAGGEGEARHGDQRVGVALALDREVRVLPLDLQPARC